jgi:hypothetical protein
VPGRDEAHHVAAHHGLGAALAGFRRVLQLLADGDAEALADQPLQVLVGAVDRHAAHGMSSPRCLPRLVSTIDERLRRGNRVLEEQLVEIAHAVEQQAVGIGRLDLQELRHGGVTPAGVTAGPVVLAPGLSPRTEMRAGRLHGPARVPPFRFPRSRAMSLRLVPNPCGKD